MPEFSANTEIKVCDTCDGGATVFEVTPPHPVWTNAQNNSVIQLNMITLGGENGLNN